ncbi:pancreatic triacylglycerol lipase-like [Arctopsyche grandis]|uniref:pancreatic triacylglycerol lipase-like n=1 Tax=Arctopsyche grandis TaxID=121162 RepID=UPI00406D79AD
MLLRIYTYKVLFKMTYAFILIAVLISVQYIDCHPTKFNPITDVGLNLFSRKNPTVSQPLKNGDLENLSASNFQMDKRLIIFSHGWTNMANSPNVVEAFLKWSDVNVILIDWTKGTSGPEEGVVANAPLVGKFVASYIDWLSTLGFKFDNVHLIGVSLGTHVVGWAGRSCQRGKIPYLTACDPSRKFWDDNPDRVNAGDAVYVEVIHTNTDYHGLIYPTGTADFYPNSGTKMPGCSDDFNQLCSHMRSVDYLLDSIDHKRFVSNKCNSYDEMISGNCANIDTSYMGGAFPKNLTGVYYLTTNAEQPYYQG